MYRLLLWLLSFAPEGIPRCVAFLPTNHYVNNNMYIFGMGVAWIWGGCESVCSCVCVRVELVSSVYTTFLWWFYVLISTIEKPGEQCTVVFALTVTEPAMVCVCVGPLTSQFRITITKTTVNCSPDSSWLDQPLHKIGSIKTTCPLPESFEWFIESQAFSRSYDSAPRPPPPHFPVSNWVSSTGDTQEDWERETNCWRERGRGWGRSQIIRRRESLILYKSFNTLFLLFLAEIFDSWGTERTFQGWQLEEDQGDPLQPGEERPAGQWSE